MSRPRILDVFCGPGGAAMGYCRAGYEVFGVDHRPQPHYPFVIYQADALEFLAEHGHKFDAIHASPPCQGYSAMNRMVQAEHPRLIGEVRQLLEAAGRPYVIENVEGAELEAPAVVLCGTMFGLKVRRHRVFEIRPPALFLLPPCQCRNGVRDGRLIGHRVAGKVRNGRAQPPRRTEAERREAMGCPWMTTREARQAVPPDYTEWVGKQLRAALAAGSN